MDKVRRLDYPNIVPCLVLPFEKPCVHGNVHYPALVFAQRGHVILFAAEYARRFGVGTLDATGHVAESTQFATLDLASREFLARAA